MFSPSSIGRLLRRLHRLRSRDPVPEELRGWSWWRPPLQPRAHLGLGVSEIAYRYCPTRRDVWLRRVRGVESLANDGMIRGRIVHEAFRTTARDVSRLYISGLEPYDIVASLVSRAEERSSSILSDAGVGEKNSEGNGYRLLASRVYKKFVFYWASWIEETRQPPWYVEYIVDGSMLGLSPRLRIDALGLGLVIEVKLGQWRSDYPTGLAGYALALEASHEIPVDYGLVLLVSGDGDAVDAIPVYIGSDERTGFIEARDEVIEMLLSGNDPGMPPKCPQSCPYRRICAPSSYSSYATARGEATT